jgi:MFS family permease
MSAQAARLAATCSEGGLDDGIAPDSPQSELHREREVAPPASSLLAPALQLYPALGVPTFRLLWLCTLPGTLSWMMSIIATGYAAYIISGSATVLGLVSAGVGLPMLLFSLVGGVAADRLPRRMVLLATESIFAVATTLLALVTVAGWLEVWHLVAFTLIQGTAMSFNMPTRQVYIAELVGARLLRNAVALNNAGLNFCRVAGPALAGALLAAPGIGVGGVFVAMALMYGVVLVLLLRLPASKTPERGQRRPGTRGWAELVEGLVYIGRSPALLALLGLAFVPLIFGVPYQTLMPLFAEEVFVVGAAGLGALMTASGIGALLGALAVAALSGYSRPGLLQLALGVAFGLSLVGFALSPSFLLAVGLLVVVGFTLSAYNTLNNTLIMGNTEPRLYGRVMSVYLLTFAVMPLASLPAAWMADHVGGRAVVAGGGLVIALVVVGVATLYPRYRDIH